MRLCKNRKFSQVNCKQGIVTVIKDKCNTYWISVIIDDFSPIPLKTKVEEKSAIGIDLGIKHYAILSNGIKYNNPKFYEKDQKKLARLQKILSRTQKGSKRHEKARLNVAKCHKSIRNKKLDFIHKLTTTLVKTFDTICLEDFNKTNIIQNNYLAKSIQSVS